MLNFASFSRRAVASCAAVALWSVAVLPAHAARLKMEVGGANFRPVPIAVPALRRAAGASAAVTAARAEGLTLALREGLGLARSLSLVPPSTYLPEEGSVAAPRLPAWSAVGASGVITGELADVRGSVGLQLHFFSVANGQQPVQQACSLDAADAEGRRCLHQFLDQVVESLTGEKGIYSSRLAFAQRQGRHKQIFSCALDGAELRQETRTPTLNLLPAWDAAGAYLLFTSFASGNADLLQVRRADGQQSPISRAPGLNTGAAVSPDGKYIALTLSRDGNTEIYVMDRDGRNLRRLTHSWGQDVSPTWSPDGQSLAFVSSRSGNPQIYVMKVDGSGVRRLTFAGTYNQEPDWSPRPDGQIAFTARDERLQFDIFLVHPQSGAITRLTQDQGRNESPSHSPDGHHLTFMSTRGAAGGKRIWVMDVDGNAPRPLPVQVGEAEAPSWGPRLGH